MDNVDYIFNYIMDDIEFSEADSIANTVNQFGGLHIDIGNPTIKPATCGSVKVIERNFDYYYYFLFYDINGNKNFFNVSQLINAYMFDALARHKALLLFLTFARVPELNLFHLHEGFLVKEHQEGDVYWLEQAANVSNLNQEIQHAVCNQEPVFDKIQCDCGHVLFMNKNETRSITCPMCNQYIRIHS